MQAQEELASLFHRNLTFQNSPLPVPVTQVPVEQPQAEEPIVYSASQHYYQPTYVVSEQPSRPASTPNATEQESAEMILSRNGVDVATLFSTQIDLFKTADQGQQLRLIELWRICPPNYGGHALAQDLGNWPATSFEQEEAMAKLRYERQMLEERASRIMSNEPTQSEEMMSDPEPTQHAATMQDNNSCWATYTANNNDPEPYMLSGYEALAQRDYNVQARFPAKDVYSHFGTSVGGPTYKHATDPVYNKRAEWNPPSQQEQIENMENAYGQYQAANFCQRELFVHGEDHEML